MQKKKVYTTLHKKRRRVGQKMMKMTATTVTVMTEGTVTAEGTTGEMTGGKERKKEIEDKVGGGTLRGRTGTVTGGVVKVLGGVTTNQGLKMSPELPGMLQIRTYRCYFKIL